MKKRYAKSLLVALLTFAMLLTSANATLIGGATASAAKAKKVTLKLKKTKASVVKGKKVTLKITKKNVKKIKSKKWASKNKKIATVNKKGVVTAKKVGKTTITCKVKYIAKGSKKVKTKTLKCKVTVKKKTAPKTTKKPTTTVKPTATPLVKYNDTSNIGAAREVTIAGGTSDKMTVYDNGSVRKDLSSQYLIKNEMGQGINLGNTMEATKALGEIDNFKEATDFEQAWAAPITTEAMIKGMHSYGFNTLRIPVAWSSMVSKDGKYTINEKMLGRVEEIINYGLNNGMYVIINDHWDYGWWGQFGSSDPEVVKKAWARYESYWTQITERYKDYSDHLIFESANEELCVAGFTAEVDSDGYKVGDGDSTKMTTDQAYELANQINQKFVDIVRASGGNNAYRHLLIAGINTNIGMTTNDKFVMPTDTAENGVSKLSVSVHYYDPWAFCGDGNSGDYTASDKQHTQKTFALLEKFTKAGYGVMIGEYGVCNPRQDKVTDWLYDVMEVSAKYNCLPILWDYHGIYYDRNACKMKYKDVAQLFNQVTGAKGDTNIAANTGKPNNDIKVVEASKLTDEKLVWSWEGQWAKNDAKNIGLDGNVVTGTDVTKFVQTTKCTDESKITFNSWGYQTFLHLDWSKYKNPVIRVTFKADAEDIKTAEDAIGQLKLATCSKPDAGDQTDEQGYEFKTWYGKGIGLSAATLASLEQKPCLYLTFGNAPIVTGIYVYDLG